jgi:CRP/FNR family cyclic AMP-dependent transcriptional regulator
MKRERKLPFDPKVFLSKVNGGRTISDYRTGQIVYTQGEPADAVFYIQSGRLRRPSSPSRGRKPWSHFWIPAISLGKGA